MADEVSQALNKERIPEHALPPSLGDLPLAGKLDYLESRAARIRDDMDAVERERRTLSLRWAPLYTSVRKWVDERLALLDATAAVYETALCFCVYGWMPSHEVEGLRARLDASFGDHVVLTEKELREKDLERVPVTLSNPPFFRPFEIFTRLLPVPSYGSFDPTPFFGIFFPLFFGMILGDAGYGLVLIILATILLRRFRRREMAAAALKVLVIASIYTILFGVLYGEYFGDLGLRLLGIEPIWVERRTAIIPMLSFAIAVGVVHILLGLIFGIIAAFRRKARREAASRILNVALLLCLIVVIASSFGLFPEILTRPMVVVMLFLMPLLFFTGGLLAPLEVLKSIGNMVSYVRIMAIGLTSVMLAYVANSLAGQMGNLLVGAILAVLLHALNMILGVFAPTIHALRLHYVEFFTKFFEPGGRRFDPFRSTPAPPPSDRPEALSPESGGLPRRAGSAGIESHHSPAEVPTHRKAA
jgi:V/A-type H+-transporting ATPase subunit I